MDNSLPPPQVLELGYTWADNGREDHDHVSWQSSQSGCDALNKLMTEATQTPRRSPRNAARVSWNPSTPSPLTPFASNSFMSGSSSDTLSTRSNTPITRTLRSRPSRLSSSSQFTLESQPSASSSKLPFNPASLSANVMSTTSPSQAIGDPSIVVDMIKRASKRVGQGSDMERRYLRAGRRENLKSNNSEILVSDSKAKLRATAGVKKSKERTNDFSTDIRKAHIPNSTSRPVSSQAAPCGLTIEPDVRETMDDSPLTALQISDDTRKMPPPPLPPPLQRRPSRSRLHEIVEAALAAHEGSEEPQGLDLASQSLPSPISPPGGDTEVTSTSETNLNGNNIPISRIHSTPNLPSLPSPEIPLSQQPLSQASSSRARGPGPALGMRRTISATGVVPTLPASQSNPSQNPYHAPPQRKHSSSSSSTTMSSTTSSSKSSFSSATTSSSSLPARQRGFKTPFAKAATPMSNSVALGSVGVRLKESEARKSLPTPEATPPPPPPPLHVPTPSIVPPVPHTILPPPAGFRVASSRVNVDSTPAQIGVGDAQSKKDDQRSSSPAPDADTSFGSMDFGFDADELERVCSVYD
ncbi:hypothetical protein BD410DRAFT_380976 [Rickenella mellea]|uniref:Uncharacterized protein n=1 Tax=Rickenella mellea TaxID=50990 RepID=A0A4Y7PZD3_9AGAM|nr:hypothetical protein BD410DRAFT_380976 [Rickenella mellea]